MSIQSAINGIKTSKSNIRTAINNKGGNVSSSAKLSTYATAINNLTFSLSETRTINNNTGGGTSLKQDITIGTNVTEALLVVDTILVGNENTISCARKSGATVSISTKTSKTSANFSAYGISPIVLQTITYKITKAKGSSSVVTLTVSNSYGLAGVVSHLITN